MFRKNFEKIVSSWTESSRTIFLLRFQASRPLQKIQVEVAFFKVAIDLPL